MANGLDEMNDPVLEEGRDVNVIAKSLPVTCGWGTKFFEVLMWILFIIPGIVLTVKKIHAKVELQQIEQKLQHDASQIDNYLEQRVVILSNLAKLVEQAVELDKETYTAIAEARSGARVTGGGDEARNESGTRIENLNARLNLAIEAYPQLQAHQEIKDAIQQNSYLQREITAAREVYNSTVATWNRKIFIWPVYVLVAVKEGYRTRIPFATSKEIKEKARDVFF